MSYLCLDDVVIWNIVWESGSWIDPPQDRLKKLNNVLASEDEVDSVVNNPIGDKDDLNRVEKILDIVEPQIEEYQQTSL